MATFSAVGGSRRRGGLNVLHSVFGLICLVLGLLGIIFWWSHFGFVLRGLIPLLLVIIGFIALASGISQKGKDGEDDTTSEDK
jgi:hypothetical protein